MNLPCQPFQRYSLFSTKIQHSPHSLSLLFQSILQKNLIQTEIADFPFLHVLHGLKLKFKREIILHFTDSISHPLERGDSSADNDKREISGSTKIGGETI
jgi:hypothetical protein